MRTKNKAEYDMQYAKKNLKRIPLNVQKNMNKSKQQLKKRMNQ